MTSQLLVNVISVTVPAATVRLPVPHGLRSNGRDVAPTFAIPSGQSPVFVESVDATNVYLTNPTDEPLEYKLRVERGTSIEVDAGNTSLFFANTGDGAGIATGVAEVAVQAPLVNSGTDVYPLLGLADVGTADVYGANDSALTLTTDAKGRVTAVSAAPIAIAQSQVTGLGNALNGKANASVSITAEDGLTGGGDLTASRTISLPNVGTMGSYGSASAVPVLTTDAKGRVTAVTPTNIQITESQVTGLESDISAIEGDVSALKTDVSNIETALTPSLSGQFLASSGDPAVAQWGNPVAGGILGYTGSTYPNPTGLRGVGASSQIPLLPASGASTIELVPDNTDGAGTTVSIRAGRGDLSGGTLSLHGGKSLSGVVDDASIRLGGGISGGRSGSIWINPGRSGVGNCGYLYITGALADTGNAGDTYVSGGPRAGTASGNGGSLYLTGGNGAGTGIAGNVYIGYGSGTTNAVVVGPDSYFIGKVRFESDIRLGNTNNSGVVGQVLTSAGPNAAATWVDGSVTVSSGTGLSGGGLVTLGGSTTLSLADTAVTIGSYGSASSVATFTVDQQGRLTAAASTPISVTASAISSGTFGASVNVQNVYQQVTAAISGGGGALTLGQVVYIKISGGSAAAPAVDLAVASSAMVLNTIGLVASASIANSAAGFIVNRGVLTGLNTSGFTQGDILYVDPTTPGALTNVMPTYPNYAVPVGIVIVKNATTGAIYVGSNIDMNVEPQVKMAAPSSKVNVPGATTNISSSLFTSPAIEYLALDPQANVTLSGGPITALTSADYGRKLTIHNVSATRSITFNSGGTAYLTGGVNLTLNPNSIVSFVWSFVGGGVGRWVQYTSALTVS